MQAQINLTVIYRNRLFETEKSCMLSRIENSINSWSRRGSSIHEETYKLHSKVKPLSLRSNSRYVSTSLVSPKINTSTEAYVLNPGKDTYAGMKPVFSNSSNQLNKGKNQLVSTEHHLRFPIFINKLPKDGLKSLNEYKNIVKKFIKVDKKVEKEFLKIKSNQVNSKYKCGISVFNSPKNSFSKSRTIENIKKKYRANNSLSARKGKLNKPKRGARRNQSLKNSFVLERVIGKYIRHKLKRQKQEGDL
mmetsp:Transcript_20725/g.18368  ORF Transcript_20725/g.18368 Transcript_20725/m.18368 type:complete len:248 (+) Transcript_20725:411-1154(+)